MDVRQDFIKNIKNISRAIILAIQDSELAEY